MSETLFEMSRNKEYTRENLYHQKYNKLYWYTFIKTSKYEYFSKK